jgi:membrane-associated phospholipid phosphatase
MFHEMMMWLFRLRPAQSLTIVFSFFLLVLTVTYQSAVPSAGYLIVIYASILVFQATIASLRRPGPFLAVTRDLIFPVIGVLVIFDSLGPLVHSINGHDIDYLLIKIDYLIFGVHPSVFLEGMITPVLTDVLQIAYSGYYFLPILLGIILKSGNKGEAFDKAVFIILLCFYLSYIGYILFPAVGPRYTMQHLYDKDIDGFLVSRPIQNMLNLLEGVKRDAFPSGHTAIALTVLFLARKYERTFFWWTIIPVLLLIFSTVYCRYHYVVDVIFGVILAVVTVSAGEVYYNFWLRMQNGNLQQ